MMPDQTDPRSGCRKSRLLGILPLTALVAGLLLAAAGCPSQAPVASTNLPDPPLFRTYPQPGDATAYGLPLALNNTAQFIEYYSTYKLSADQKTMRDAALSELRAPCCDDFPMSTCCCDCNLAKSVWGLSAYLISEKGFDAAAVKAAAEQWLEFIRPDYFRVRDLLDHGLNPGDYGLVHENSCYVGKCGLPFAQGGCGGMGALNLGQ